MTTTEELISRQDSWTVRDADGVIHRAYQQFSGSFTRVITACQWSKIRITWGQAALVRVDETPTCLKCTMLEIADIGKPKCVHCGLGQGVHNSYTHAFHEGRKPG
jgi:hypothetical protein